MRKIAVLAEAHFVTVAPHNPMGPLATAVNLHFCGRDLELQDPGIPPAQAYMDAGRTIEGSYVKDPYLPEDGYLQLAARPARLGRRDRRGLPGARTATSTGSASCPVKPDGSFGYP